MINSYEIARLAGVSQSTVSRVLNNASNVRPETAERVWRVIREHGFTPNALARSLAKQRADAIGIFFFYRSTSMPLEGHIWMDLIVRSCRSVAEAKGFMLAVESIDTNEDMERALATVRQHRVDGAIFYGNGPQGFDLTPFMEAGTPLAMVNRRRLPDAPKHVVQVSAANADGAYAAIEHLYSLGHRRIAIMTGELWRHSVEERLTGYRRLLEPLGLFDPSLVIEGDQREMRAYQTTLSLLQGPWKEPQRRPTAIFATTDRVATGIFVAAARAGLRVPEDLSIVGFDHQGYTSFPLTSVYFPVAEICQTGMERLVRLIEGQPVRKREVVVPCRLVIGPTTAPPRQA